MIQKGVHKTLVYEMIVTIEIPTIVTVFLNIKYFLCTLICVILHFIKIAIYRVIDDLSICGIFLITPIVLSYIAIGSPISCAASQVYINHEYIDHITFCNL